MQNIAQSNTNESMLKATENGDICLICNNVIRILVVPNRSCECRQRVCLHCFRDYLGLNEHSDSERYKCLLNCGRKLRGSPPYTVADLVELGKLDELYGTISCPRECGWIGTRSEFQRLHRQNCPNISIPCIKCKQLIKRGKQRIVCLGCYVVLIHCEYPEHRCLSY
jgi:hypothetical protein